jgi:hypothetical protein
VLSRQSSSQEPEINGSNVSAPVPVVFGNRGDGFPEQFKLRGVIAEASFSRACGTVWWSGTLRIKLLDRVKGYPHKNVFVVVNCLSDSSNERRYLGKVVTMEVSKLYSEYSKIQGPDHFYFELIDNTIDSKGIPFYCTRMWRDQILAFAPVSPRPRVPASK